MGQIDFLRRSRHRCTSNRYQSHIVLQHLTPHLGLSSIHPEQTKRFCEFKSRNYCILHTVVESQKRTQLMDVLRWKLPSYSRTKRILKDLFRRHFRGAANLSGSRLSEVKCIEMTFATYRFFDKDTEVRYGLR